jgi:hypothetical protein
MATYGCIFPVQLFCVNEAIMAMKRNERYRCVNPKCCCEIEVVKESLDATSVRNPRCACGQDMKKMY